MRRRITGAEAQADFPAFLDAVESGEEIEITRNGRIVARLAPVRTSRSLKDRFSGVAVSAADEDEMFSTGAWESR